jgi:hypothetical protein
MLARGVIAELGALRDPGYAVQSVRHNQNPTEAFKFGGAIQTSYTCKNWSSLMLLNSSACTVLTPELVNTASGLHLHRCAWLKHSGQVCALPIGRWNHLVDGEPPVDRPASAGGSALVHWTLGGPWLRDYRQSGGPLADEWHAAHAAATKLG